MSTDITVRLGDCLDIMRELPDASVDAVVTDPPYGLGFMGKAWDDLPPGREWAEACLRVLKPGGYLVAFGGTRTWHRLAVAVEDAGFEIRDSIAWMHGQGFPKGKASLKPAFEPIVVARKKPTAPRTGLLNIDACRVAGPPSVGGSVRKTALGMMNDDGWRPQPQGIDRSMAAGRWPANVVLDESQAAALDEMSGELTSPAPYERSAEATRSGAVFGYGFGDKAFGSAANNYGDQGGASRFFYVAKADASERVRVNGVAHPTVKPLALMRWLVRLVTPPGGTVLEPFAGSGTTVEACISERLSCFAIEREAEYLPLIRQRIFRRTAPDKAIKASGEDGGLFDLLDGGAA